MKKEKINFNDLSIEQIEQLIEQTKEDVKQLRQKVLKQNYKLLELVSYISDK